MASIRCGPGSASAFANCSASSSAVVARDAGTPIPWDSGRSRGPAATGRAARSPSGPRRPRPDPRQLHPQDRVRPVVQQHGRDVQALARLRPQRRHRVHGAAVGLQARPPAGRGRRSPHRRRPAVPWPMAPPVIVSTSWRGAPAVVMGIMRPDVLASSDDDRALRQQRADDFGPVLRRQRTRGHRRPGRRLQHAVR